jgi:chitosanase
MITDTVKEKILRVLRVMETGKSTPQYDKMTIFADGPVRGGKRMKQITFGALQTTEFGNMDDLISNYLSRDGLYDSEFEPFVGRIGREQLWNNQTFKNLLIKAARTDPAMRQAQDWLFEEKYWKPALKFFNDNGFKLPLSMLIIFDSFIHSGSILMFLRKRFPEKTPANGGDEKRWITQYINVRHEWLKNHSTPILRKTIYRTRDYIREIKENNWLLDGIVEANGTPIKHYAPINKEND